MKYFYILMLLIIIGCNQSTEDVKPATLKEEKNEFFPNFLQRDTLYLYVRLDDCGEWGGPEEHFTLYSDSLSKYRFEYKRYRFNCDSIEKYYSNEKPLEFSTTFELDENKKKNVSAFLGKIMQSKISEEVNSNAGSIYYVHSNDSTLNISIYSEQKKIKEDFYTFKRSLGLPENRYNNRLKIPLTDNEVL